VSISLVYWYLLGGRLAQMLRAWYSTTSVPDEEAKRGSFVEGKTKPEFSISKASPDEDSLGIA
jgi:hypothetical protein